MRISIIFGLLLVATTAHADPPKSVDDHVSDLTSALGNNYVPVDPKAPRLAFTDRDTQIDKPGEGAMGGGYNTSAKHTVTAWSADKKVAWIAEDILLFGNCCCGPCDLVHPIGTLHATIVVEVGAEWHWVAFDATGTETDAQQAKAQKAGKVPPAFARKIDAGAEDAVKLFEASIADPKALAATISDRKDVVLYGSGLDERFTGPAVAAQLGKWNLALKVRDGVQAGVAGPTGSVAWIAANVDATSLKKPKDKPLPYRLFAVYEKTAAGWKLVSANFSVFDNG